MANLPESNTWESVRQWETTDPALGGADTLFTQPVRNLTNRTKYLKTLLDNVVSGVQGIVGKLLDGSTCANNYSSAQEAGYSVANTLFVQNAVSLKGGRRNYLLNGDFGISQRGESWTIAAGETKFIMDRWRAFVAADTGAMITLQRDNENLNANLPGYRYGVMITFPSAATSVEIRQRILNGYTLEDLKATLQFFLKLSASCSIDVSLRRYLNQDQIDDDDPEWTESHTIAGSSGAHLYSQVFDIDPVADAVVRDIDDQGCLEVVIKLDHVHGASLSAVMTNVQLEVGILPTAFEQRDDLAECLTYFEKVLVSERNDRLGTGGEQGQTQVSWFERLYYSHKRRVPDITKENVIYANVEELSDIGNISRNCCTLEWKPLPYVSQVGVTRSIRMDMLVDAEI